MVMFNAPKQTPSSNAGVSLGGRAESGIGQGVDLILPRLVCRSNQRPGQAPHGSRHATMMYGSLPPPVRLARGGGFEVMQRPGGVYFAVYVE